MSIDLLATTDPEAAAFFADARATLDTWPSPYPDKPAPLPADWPITPEYTGETLTRSELHARRGHALRISYDWMNGRQTLWVARWRGGEWSILQGYPGKPATLLTSSHSWDAAVCELTSYTTPGRMYGGDNFLVDEWADEYTTVCLVHAGGCGDSDDDHNFVQRRTLPRYPVGTYRPCGGGSARVLGGGVHDGAYQYRFQVEGRWRLRFGCRSHHAGLLAQHLAEADGTVTVRRMDDHLATP